mgnify:CR=1 FL=1
MMFFISESELSYIDNVGSGEGLIKFGHLIVPFCLFELFRFFFCVFYVIISFGNKQDSVRD